MTSPLRWLGWVRELQAIAQTGVSYGADPFDHERYERIRAIAAEIAAEHTGLEPGPIRELFAGETGHATPKVDVRGVIFRAGAVLLVKERADGRWTLPGGWVDVGETPSQAVEREVREEAGCAVRAVKLLAVFDRNKHVHPPHIWHIYKLFFRCELTEAVHDLVPPNPETEAVAFFEPQTLPDLAFGKATAGQIARFFEHYDHPEWPTDFD